MLDHLTLLLQHRENLLERGLPEERIAQNQYRSMPETGAGRRLLAALLRSGGHELLGIPGFRTYYGDWTLSGLVKGAGRKSANRSDPAGTS